MDSLKKILDLMQNERGKIFITDENGDPVYVIMPLSEYERFQHKRQGQGQIEELLRRVVDLTDQTEELNRQITEAQMEEEEDDVWDVQDVESEALEAFSLDETFYIEPIETNRYSG